MTYTGELRPFQEVAKNRAIEAGAFLVGHDLGLGKTHVGIAVLEELIDKGEVTCALILAPASVKWQWARQIKKFTDGALVKVIEGTKADRMAAYRSVKRGDLEYVIMNYEQIVGDWDIIKLLNRSGCWDAIVADEIVYIKSPGAARSQAVKRLKAPYRIGLTGQMIENKPEDAFSIMQWIDPTVLGDENAFDHLFINRKSNGQVFNYKNLPLFQERMADVWDLKHWDEPDIKVQMPRLNQEEYIIDFDPASARLYKIIASELLDMIQSMPNFSTFDVMDHYAGVHDASAQGQIMTRITALQMLCDHPDLLRHSARLFDDPFSAAGSEYVHSLRQAHLLDKAKRSTKLNATIEEINFFLDDDPKNKVVLFSFFKPMLSPIISSQLDPKRGDFVLFTGDMTTKARDRSIVRFNEDKTCRIFLSSDAGGIGVDLPAGNQLMSYDLPWSAGKLRQRMGRIMRLSSTWSHVTIQSMLMRDSIEERKFDMLAEKIAVADAWVRGRGVKKDGSFDLTLGSLAEFLEDSLSRAA